MNSTLVDFSMCMLDFVQSPRAKSKIKAWFAKEALVESSDVGREDLTKLMRREGLPFKKLMGGDALLMIARELGAADLQQLFFMIGEGKLSATFVVKRLIAAHGGAQGLAEDLSSSVFVPARQRTDAERPAVEVTGIDDVLVKLIAKDGVKLARRTAAKYREMQNIPSSFDRRRQSVMAGQA